LVSLELPVGSREPRVELLVVEAERLEAELARRRGRVLMAKRYGGPLARLDAEAPLAEVPNRVLCGAPRAEIWITPRPATCHRANGLTWAEDGRALFGCSRRRAGERTDEDTFAAYREVFALLDERGYRNLLRVWNYLPRINQDQRGVECYKRFNVGRARSFEERYGCSVETEFSASTAVGTPGEDLVVCFAAGREPGIHLENPRQTCAYRYPPEYGPKSPSFARGTLAPAGWGETFFLSGTASVVGHETKHPGDPLGQLDEALANIDALLDCAAGRSGRGRAVRGARFDLLKTYVRRREDFPAIREALAKRLDPATPAIYLEADICRKDLLLEIEGVWR
jgi:chorismate lyase/3-hydroxybenzoate synthase